MKPQTEYPLRIYYDASCPLCRAELHSLKTRDEAEALELVDCSGSGFSDPDLQQAGIAVGTAMARIHARDAHGRWFDGVDVFQIAYGAAGMERTARVLGNRRLRPLLDRLYPVVAKHRHWLTRLGLAPVMAWVLRRRDGKSPRQS